MKPVLKAPGSMDLNLRYDAPLSNLVNNFNLRRCILDAVCSIALTAGAHKWAKGFELNASKHEGFPPGFYGERFLPFRIPPGWPATTHGALVRCHYGVRAAFSLPNTLNLTLDVPVSITPTASMYSAAGAYTRPLFGSTEAQSVE